jgi:protein O-GlcNAc transferase
MHYHLRQVLQLVRLGQKKQALSLLLPHLPLSSLPSLAIRQPLAVACFNLALDSQLGLEFKIAAELYQQAVVLAPDFLQAWLALTGLYAREQHWPEAEAAFAQAQILAPTSIDVLLLKGNLAQLREDFENAIVAYQLLLEQVPQHAGAWNNLGLIWYRQTNYDSALRCFRQAITFQLDFAEAWCNLGLVLLNSEQPEAAHSALLEALRLQPQRVETLSALAIWAQHQKQLQAAEDFILQALAIDPYQLEAATQLTWLFYRQNRFSEALAHLDDLLVRVLSSERHQAHLLYIRARLLDFLEQHTEAKRFYVQSLCLEPKHRLRQLHAALPGPADRLFDSAQQMQIWQSQFASATHLFEPGFINLDQFLPELMQEPVETGWGLLYQGDWPLSLKTDYTALFRVPEYELPERRAGERKRLGYLVSWEHEGIFLKFLGGLIRHLDPECFEIYIICAAAVIPIMSRHLQAKHIQYLPLSPFLPANLERIRNLDLDLLEYWEVGSDNTNFALSFYRLARLQFSSLGTPVSPCIKGLDFYLSSQLLEAEQAQVHYQEKLMLLDFLPTWFPDLARDLPGRTRADFGLNERAHIYLCAQNLLKFHPDFDALLAEILDSDADSQLILFQSRTEHLNMTWKNRFEKRFPGRFERITWLKPVAYSDFLNLLALADVCLDTLYYSGGITAHESLAVGTPIVTLPGQTARSRLSLGRYAQMGLADLAVADAQAYVAQALLWGRDKEQRAAVKAGILSRKYLLFERFEAVKSYSDFLLHYKHKN